MNTYKTKGTCSDTIRFDVDEQGVVTHCEFHQGCSGNAQGLSKMVIGRSAEDVITLLKGIQCRNGTSCPDQLAKALQAHIQR